MGTTGFEWDPAKNLENIEKHGVSFDEAQLAFADERRIIGADTAHSAQEPRFYCIARIDRGIVTVRFTYRAGAIRIIGAGFWRKGKDAYEGQGQVHG